MFDIGKLRNIRKINKKNQTQVADALGISQSDYSRRESGSTPLRIDELEKLAAFYGVDVSEFLNGRTNHKPEMRGEKGTEMDYWQKEYLKLLGKYELLRELLSDGDNSAPFHRRVRTSANGGK